MKIALFVGIAAALFILATPAFGQSKDENQFEEKLLAEIPKDLTYWDDCFPCKLSPNGVRYGYLALKQSGTGPTPSAVLIVDGHVTGNFVSDGWWGFSPDSQVVAYTAHEDENWYMVRNGIKSKPTTGWITSVVFSPDSKRFGYQVQDHGFRKPPDIDYVVVDDVEQNRDYDKTYGPFFSPDSRSVAFIAKKNGKYSVVVDDKQVSEEYDEISPRPMFYGDSNNKIAFTAKNGDKWFTVVDGKRGPEYPKPVEPVVSADGRRMATVVRSLEGAFVILDGVTGETFDAIIGSPTFSPDGTRFAYVAAKSKKGFVVVDGRKGEDINNGALWMQFSPDGKHLAYVLLNGSTRKYTLIVDGMKSEEFDCVASPRWKEDSTRIAFAARIGSQLWRKVWIFGK